MTAEMIGAAYHRRVEVDGRRYDAQAQAHIQSAARWIVEGRSIGLMCSGSVGNGKTTLAFSIADVLRYIPKPVKVYTALTLVQLASEDVESFRRDILCVPFLVVDDLGMEGERVKSFGTEIDPIVQLFEERYRRNLPMICTTNLDAQGVAEKYGARVADRIRQRFAWIYFNEKSYRARE